MTAPNTAQTFYQYLQEAAVANKALAKLKAKYAPRVPAGLNFLGAYTAPARPSRRRAVIRHLARFAEFVASPLVKPTLFAIKRTTLAAGLTFRDKESWVVDKAAMKRALAEQRVEHVNAALHEEKRLAGLADHALTAKGRKLGEAAREIDAYVSPHAYEGARKIEPDEPRPDTLDYSVTEARVLAHMIDDAAKSPAKPKRTRAPKKPAE